MAKSSKKSKKSKTGKPKIRPLGEKILIKRLDPEEVTSGGIILPDSAREKPQKGTVIEVGDGRELADGTRAAFQVKKGDQVLFASYSGTEIKVGDEELMLMDEGEILAILG